MGVARMQQTSRLIKQEPQVKTETVRKRKERKQSATNRNRSQGNKTKRPLPTLRRKSVIPFRCVLYSYQTIVPPPRSTFKILTFCDISSRREIWWCRADHHYQFTIISSILLSFLLSVRINTVYGDLFLGTIHGDLFLTFSTEYLEW